MRLDRNINPRRYGKYALVNMRKLWPLIEASQNTRENFQCIEAYYILKEHGFITEGNESPGDQFFVLKYKDKFSHHALSAYAAAVEIESMSPFPTELKIKNPELKEFADEIRIEAKVARQVGKKIPT